MSVKKARKKRRGDAGMAVVFPNSLKSSFFLEENKDK